MAKLLHSLEELIQVVCDMLDDSYSYNSPPNLVFNNNHSHIINDMLSCLKIIVKDHNLISEKSVAQALTSIIELGIFRDDQIRELKSLKRPPEERVVTEYKERQPPPPKLDLDQEVALAA